MPLKAQRLSKSYYFYSPCFPYSAYVPTSKLQNCSAVSLFILVTFSFGMNIPLTYYVVYKTFHKSSPSHLQSINAFCSEGIKKEQKIFRFYHPNHLPIRSWRWERERDRRGSVSSRPSEVSWYCIENCILNVMCVKSVIIFFAVSSCYWHRSDVFYF